jgi:hypothetical protein
MFQPPEILAFPAETIFIVTVLMPSGILSSNTGWGWRFERTGLA